jgi:hypothetical protein
MTKYRKKPIVVEAVQYTGDTQSVQEVRAFTGRELEGNGRDLFIETLEGILIIHPSAWVVKGAAGKFYLYDNDIFIQTHELVE